ncbi:MAG: 1-deoxy-D-xylulose-5-phosphate reductoisomerase, partial [Marinobacter sp.]
MVKRRVSILGATGSIGLSTLDVIRRHPERFSVSALTASTSVDSMVELCHEFRPRYAVMADENAAAALSRALSDLPSVMVLGGSEALCQVAGDGDSDTVMAAIVGAVGLPPTLASVRAGKRVLLANKEALVMSGKLFMDAVLASGADVLPIDSEHNAIFQCMPPDKVRDTRGAGITRI